MYLYHKDWFIFFVHVLMILCKNKWINKKMEKKKLRNNTDPQPPSRHSRLCVQFVEGFHQSVRSPAVPWCKDEEMTQQQEEITCSPSIKASLCKWRGRREGRHEITSRTEVVGWRWDDGMMSPSAPHQALSSHIKQPIKSPGLWGMQGGDTAVNSALCWLWKLMF